ncbi:major facilitator superfamily transporter [Colletotrichum graminicola]|uniref:Major facilitator superfamily transporter n=1 Tax=Colletotrichum graminicola (strain M1.001 / M2 / FGSC 10212) TaxID=645133 RepID=E3QWR6_COLGM|nr:major facilitator superfamily transporter [Colletotrichum graminicola M1.001]EFQ35304.1 major facilitator superfamily transporter [Colletotrichum graminicola M1.001]WDK22118.1 major facilitator superfamily transporter [Colletotrichum graminicola]
MDSDTTTISSLEAEKKRGPDTVPASGPTPAADLQHDDKVNKSTKLDAKQIGHELTLGDDTTKYPSGFKMAVILLSLVLAIFLASLDMTIVATAIPKITDEFKGLSDVSWYGSAFFLTNGGFQSSWGKAYKYFPLKPTFLAALFVFELGSLICGVAPTSTALIIGRAITGVGAAGLGTGAYTIIAFVAPPRQRSMYLGIVGVAYGIASAVGPLLGGVFADRVSWRWCFYINLPIGGLSALMIFFFFQAPDAAKPTAASWREKLLQMDLLGVAMIMGALLSYVLALQYAGVSATWNSSVVVGLLVGFILILVAFGIWEYFQGERAMIVPRLFTQRPIGTACLFTLFFSGSCFLVIYYLPIYFQSVFNVSPTMSGVNNLPLIISISIAMISSGAFVSATGLAAPVMLASAAIATIASGLLYTLSVDTSTGKWIGYQILGGVAWGMAWQLPIIVGQASASASDISTVTAMVLFFMNFGGATFVSAAQAAFVNTIIDTIPSSAPAVDPITVIDTGATQIRTMFPADQVSGIVLAYMSGIKAAFAISIGATGLACIISLFCRWKRINTEDTKSSGGAV